MPLDGPASRAIHPLWSQHHRPTATATMTGECVIRRTSGGTTDPVTGDWTPAASEQVYAGRCRMQALTTNERLQVAGEEQITSRRYLIVVEYDAERVEIGDEVEITTAVDALAVGTTLRVVDVRYGTEQWQRDLIAEEVER